MQVMRDKICIIILGIIILGMGLYSAIGCNITKDLNTMEAEDFHAGMYVSGEIRGNLGAFCQENQYRYFMKTNTTNYYLVSYDERQKGWVALKTSKHEEELQQLQGETVSYINGEGEMPKSNLKIRGRVYKCNSDTLRYLSQFLLGNDIPHVDYFILETGFLDNYGMLVLAGVYAIVAMFAWIKRKKKNPDDEYLEA